MRLLTTIYIFVIIFCDLLKMLLHICNIRNTVQFKLSFSGLSGCQMLRQLLFCHSPRITRAHRVHVDFHARFRAQSRTYVYRIALGTSHDSLLPITEHDLCWNLRNT